MFVYGSGSLGFRGRRLRKTSPASEEWNGEKRRVCWLPREAGSSPAPGMMARLHVAGVSVVVLALALGLTAWLVRPASGQEVVVRLVAPATWPPDGGSFEARVEVERVVDLAAFEFKLAFDPAVLAFESIEATTFLGSTGRSVNCSNADFFTSAHDIFSYGCSTVGGEPPGPAGAGVLATVRFHPIGNGPSPLVLPDVTMTNSRGEEMAVIVEDGSIVIGRSAATPVPTPTPVGGAVMPGPGSPAATPTPLAPTLEVLPLAAGCSAATSTYPDGTPIEIIADSVRPRAVLEAFWKYERGDWLAYSPRFLEASDFTETAFLGVVLVCVSAPGEFVRPLV